MRRSWPAFLALGAASALAGVYVSWRVPILLGLSTTALAIAVAHSRPKSG